MASDESEEVMELQMSEAVIDIIMGLTEKEEAEEAVSLFLSTMVQYGLNPQAIVDAMQDEVERVDRESKH